MFIFARFEELRSSQGVTKAYIASALNRTPTLIQDWKKGKSEPSDEQLAVVAEILRTTPAYLRGETNIKNQPADDGLVNDDPELTELLQTLQDRPEFKMLFHTFKSATKEQIEAIVTAWEVRNNVKEE